MEYHSHPHHGKGVLTQPAFFYIQLLHLATRIELGRVLTASYFTYLTYRERASIMSQQGMHYEELNRDRPESSYAGYEGMPHHDSQYSTGLYGQKLSEHTSFKNPTTGQRLALALVSLFLLMIMTFGLILIGIATNVSNVGAVALVFVLVLFYVAVIIINILFNRKQ